MRNAIRCCLTLLVAVAVTPALAQKGGGKVQVHHPGQDAQQKPEAEPKAKSQKAEVGKPAPSFTLTDCCGEPHALSDLKSKIVVLEWINKECPYSIKAQSTMKATFKKFEGKDVVWLPIDSTHGRTASDDHAYVQEQGLAYSILLDPDGKVGRQYGAKTTPHMFVIDREGDLAYAGAIDDKADRNYVDEAVSALLEGKPIGVKTSTPYGCPVKYGKP